MPRMTRERDVARCPTCIQRPKMDQLGRLVCNCPRIFWFLKRGSAGSADERALLGRHGWQVVEVPDDIYWVGPAAPNALYLYEDGTWNCDTAPEEFTRLDEYLEWYARKCHEAFPGSFPEQWAN